VKAELQYLTTIRAEHARCPTALSALAYRVDDRGIPPRRSSARSSFPAKPDVGREAVMQMIDLTKTSSSYAGNARKRDLT